MNIVNWCIEHWVEIAAAFAGLTQAARLIVKLTPTPKDDSALDFVVGLLKQIGLTSDTLTNKPKSSAD